MSGAAAARRAVVDPFAPFSDRLRRDVPLAPLTTIRIGGPAERFFEPKDAADFAALLRVARETATPVKILGSGANLLISDAGIRGIVARPSRLKGISIDGPRVRVGAGEPLPPLVKRTTDLGLSGLEGLGGIPADVGGAIAMNAGGRYGWASHVLESAELALSDGRVVEVAAADLEMSYRKARLPEGAAVTAATFVLKPADRGTLIKERDRIVREKTAVQPTDARSFGCAFVNPEGASAGRLIDEAGLKGIVVGGARVSPLHGNFIENVGGATAADVLKIMELLREGVLAKFGIALVPEVKIWS